MRWSVVYHPDLQQSAVIPESALENHRARGWRRISDWVTDQTLLNPAAYDTETDLDEPEPKTTTTKKKAAAAADKSDGEQS